MCTRERDSSHNMRIRKISSQAQSKPASRPSFIPRMANGSIQDARWRSCARVNAKPHLPHQISESIAAMNATSFLRDRIFPTIGLEAC